MPTWPCVQNMRLHARQHKDRAVIRQICNIKPEVVATVRSRELKDLELILREKASHGEGSSGVVRTACHSVIYRLMKGPKMIMKK